MPNTVTIRLPYTHVWNKIDLFVRKLIRWALYIKLDTRIELLHIVANLPSAQILALKRFIRYFSKLSDKSRHVSECFDQLNQPSGIVANNTFRFFTEFAQTQLPMDYSASTPYALFRDALCTEITNSARLTTNGMLSIC